MSYMSLYQIAVFAIEDLHLDGTFEAAWFMRKAQNAARKLRSWSGLRPKECCLEIDNDGRACVPCDFYRVLAVMVHSQKPVSETSSGAPSAIRTVGGLLYYLDAPLLRRVGINTGNWCGTSRGYTIDGDILQLDGQRNCIVHIAYMAYNMNEQGQMNIAEDWEDYLTNYICWEYCRAFPQLKPQYILNSYEQTWKASFRGIRSDETERQMFNNKAQLANLMNRYTGLSNLRVFN